MNLALKLVAVIPTHISSLSPHITVAWYTISFVRHLAFFEQLHFLSSFSLFLSSFLLFPSITHMFGMQLYESFTVFLLKILCNLLVGGKHLVIIFKNSFPMLVFTFKS